MKLHLVVLVAVAAPVAGGYCTTSAKSERDCLLCKYERNNATIADVNETNCQARGQKGRAPCFWAESATDPDYNPYANMTAFEVCGADSGPAPAPGPDDSGPVSGPSPCSCSEESCPQKCCRVQDGQCVAK